MRRGLLFQISYAAAARYAAQGLLMLRGLFVAQILGPALFGVWTSMRLVLVFGLYAHGGARTGMLQRAGTAQGAGDEEIAERYRRVGSALNLAGAIAAGATIVAISLAGTKGGLAGLLWTGLAVIVFVRNVNLYYRSCLRSQERFGTATTLDLTSAAFSTGLGILGAYLHGLAGFLAGLGLASSVAFLLGRILGGPYPRPAWRKREAGELLGTGAPIMAANLLTVLLWNVDKLLLWVLAGRVALGIYAAQSYVTNVLMLLPGAVAEVVYPHLVSRLGETRSRETARRHLETGTKLMVWTVAPILAVAFLSIHLPFRYWLTEYTGAIAPGRVMIVACYFPMVGTIAGSVLISLGGQRRLMLISAVAVAVSALLVGGVLASGINLVAVAVATSAGFFARAALVTIAALRASGTTGRAEPRYVGRLVFGFGAMLGAVGIARLVPEVGTGLTADILGTAARSAVAVALLAPWTLGSWVPVLRSRAAGGGGDGI